MRLATGIAAATLVAALAPVAHANHGNYGFGSAELTDGASLSVLMKYESGDGNRQSWAFTFAYEDGSSLACRGIGSIEQGFRSGTTCPVAWCTEGTAHSHSAGDVSLDRHDVGLTFADVLGTLDQTIVGW